MLAPPPPLSSPPATECNAGDIAKMEFNMRHVLQVSCAGQAGSGGRAWMPSQGRLLCWCVRAVGCGLDVLQLEGATVNPTFGLWA